MFLKNRNISSKIKISKVTDYAALIKVESIAECSHGAFCNNFDLHLLIIPNFLSFFFEWPLKIGFTVIFFILIKCRLQ